MQKLSKYVNAYFNAIFTIVADFLDILSVGGFYNNNALLANEIMFICYMQSFIC